jgi:hypothetical protein
MSVVGTPRHFATVRNFAATGAQRMLVKPAPDLAIPVIGVMRRGDVSWWLGRKLAFPAVNAS